MKPLAFTFRQLLLLFICQAVSYPFVSMGIASFVGFPIPFFALSTFPVFFTLLLAWFTAIVGRKTAKDMLKRSDQVNIHVRFMCAQMLLPVVYPIYEVLFVAASNTHFELPVILLLPILKVLMKYLITLSLAPMEDMLPESVILTVDFFHAVYLATFVIYAIWPLPAKSHHFGTSSQGGRDINRQNVSGVFTLPHMQQLRENGQAKPQRNSNTLVSAAHVVPS
ncbi:hypothetical protein PF002_g10699 [Phytophthora fragariae]|uniref:Transmembrane protein n=1 Tax=Phytophthora fragariae TaxID=53985 RepID=A0A6A3ZNM2_9STRA|nr:hypothetical protein PF002_g10699 [Phytophthora fragariae]